MVAPVIRRKPFSFRVRARALIAFRPPLFRPQLSINVLSIVVQLVAVSFGSIAPVAAMAGPAFAAALRRIGCAPPLAPPGADAPKSVPVAAMDAQDPDAPARFGLPLSMMAEGDRAAAVWANSELSRAPVVSVEGVRPVVGVPLSMPLTDNGAAALPLHQRPGHTGMPPTDDAPRALPFQRMTIIMGPMRSYFLSGQAALGFPRRFASRRLGYSWL